MSMDGCQWNKFIVFTDDMTADRSNKINSEVNSATALLTFSELIEN